MLSEGRAPAVTTLMLLLALIASPAARAEGAWEDTQNRPDGTASMTVGASTGGRPGSSSSAATSGGGCTRADGSPVPCSTDLGWWSSTYNCYLTLVREAGPEDGDHAGEGFFRCDPGGADMAWAGDVFVWLPLSAAGPDPAVLAQQAIDSMQLRGITIGTAPPAGASLLVNAPVWLWAAEPGAATWGPATATAAAGNVVVTATARAVQVRWAMGDGAVVTCGAGTPYSEGAVPSCSHTYRTPGLRAVRATTSWDVQWSSNTGVNGAQTLETFSTTTLDVRQARALVTGRD